MSMTTVQQTSLGAHTPSPLGWASIDGAEAAFDERLPKDKRSRGRLIAVDLLRGYFMFVIIVDHVGRFPAVYDVLTGRGALWASAAEGFFFISGMMVWLARGRLVDQLGMWTVARRLWRRALVLYLWMVGLALAYAYLALALGPDVRVPPGVVEQWSFAERLRETLLLRFLYGWHNFLGFYAVYLAFAPVAVWLLHRRMAPVLAATSLGLWAISGRNIWVAWQLLFFGGMVAGYYAPVLRDLVTRFSIRVRNAGFVAVGLSAVITMVLSASIILQPEPARRVVSPDRLAYYNERVAAHFDKVALPLGRLCVFALWFLALYLVLARIGPSLSNTAPGRFLLALGRRSLQVYILHSAVVFAVHAVFPPTGSLVENLMLNTGVLVFIWFVCTRPPLVRTRQL